MPEFIIAEDNDDYGNSAVTLFSIVGDSKNNIAENKKAYWVHDLIFDGELKIMKDTGQGLILSSMISMGKSASEVYDYLDKLVIKLMSINEIRIGIINERDEAFEEGKSQLKLELQLLLGWK